MMPITNLTDKEKSPGLDSLTLIRNAPSGLSVRNFSASALVIRPRYLYQKPNKIINLNPFMYLRKGLP
jgi:hypothetical protein